MIVYRITKKKYKDELTGKGAELAGGRWNSRGAPLVYASGSRALAILEVAVHIPLGNIPENYYLVCIEVPDHSTISIDVPELPDKWNEIPHSQSSQNIGDEFIRNNKALSLKAPSAIISDEYNILINPGHKSFSKVMIRETKKLKFDKRLFGV